MENFENEKDYMSVIVDWHEQNQPKQEAVDGEPTEEDLQRDEEVKKIVEDIRKKHNEENNTLEQDT